MKFEIKKVHEDERGEIHSIPLDENEDIGILVTNKGYARGGHLHPDNDEYFIVVKGSIRYFIGEDHEMYHEGMAGFIPKGESHMLVSLTNSLVMHWGARRDKDGTVIDAKSRSSVDSRNAAQTLEDAKNDKISEFEK